ncbi:hypothetical protein FB451DRAFT_1395330 [Mycena latifolia]|nr:hypothetical protein FB451DRAFT_1395330 [Mycena latifolia]
MFAVSWLSDNPPGAPSSAATLSICSAVVNVAFVDLPNPETLELSPPPAAFLRALDALPLQRLSIALHSLARLITGPRAQHVWARITHLALLGRTQWDPAQALPHLPRLTHLSTYASGFSNDDCRYALTHCTALEVLVIVCPSRSFLKTQAQARLRSERDSRLVVLIVREFLEEWETGETGCADYVIAPADDLD